jgi:hypothetical protein
MREGKGEGSIGRSSNFRTKERRTKREKDESD